MATENYTPPTRTQTVVGGVVAKFPASWQKDNRTAVDTGIRANFQPFMRVLPGISLAPIPGAIHVLLGKIAPYRKYVSNFSRVKKEADEADDL